MNHLTSVLRFASRVTSSAVRWRRHGLRAGFIASALLVAATADAVSEPPPGGADTLAAAAQRIAELRAGRALTRAEAKALRTLLDEAWAGLRAGQWTTTAAKVRAFVRKHAVLAGHGQIPAGGDSALKALTRQLTAALNVRAVRKALPAGACVVPSVVFTTLHVAKDGRTVENGATGSAARPFKSLFDALYHAQVQSFDAVEIRLGAGTFTEGPFITRPTRIIGVGRNKTFIAGYVNAAASPLVELRHLGLKRAGSTTGSPGSPGPGPSGPSGHVTNTTPCGRTVLTDVAFTNSVGGCVTVLGGSLEMTDVTCTAPVAEDGAFGSPAAIVIDGGDAKLVRVRVTDAEGYGLMAFGGTLTASGLEISGTKALDGLDRASGTAIRLSNGVHASIALATLSRNQSGGILAESLGTKVLLRFLSVSRTMNNPRPAHRAALLAPGVFDGRGAVEVRSEALVLAEYFLISRSQSVGLLVHSGGQAHFRSGAVSRVSAIGSPSNGGMCAAVLHIADTATTRTGSDAVDTPQAVLVLRDFELTRGALCGIYVHAACASARFGDVSRCAIGACLFGGLSGFTLEPDEVAHEVTYRLNGVNLQATSYPPGAAIHPASVLSLSDHTSALPAPLCDVPFVCDWCE